MSNANIRMLVSELTELIGSTSTPQTQEKMRALKLELNRLKVSDSFAYKTLLSETKTGVDELNAVVDAIQAELHRRRGIHSA